MGGKVLLDSNVLIDFFRGEQSTIDRISHLEEMAIPVIVLGELYYGAFKSNQTPRRIQELKTLSEEVPILPISAITSRIYGELKNQLRAKGRLIPENDIWIAALAREHDLPLLTRDRHFEFVEGIVVENI